MLILTASVDRSLQEAFAALTCSLCCLVVCAEAASEAEAAGGLELHTASSTPTTRSSSKGLSRQTSKSGLNNPLAVGQVGRPLGPGSCQPLPAAVCALDLI